MGRGRRGKRIHDVMAARQAQADVHGPQGGVEQEGTAAFLVDLQPLGPEVGTLADAEAQAGVAAAHHPPHADAGIVAVEHRGAARLQAAEDLALGPRHAGDVAEALQVGGGGIGDHRHRGAGDVTEIGDVAWTVGAHLHHGVTMGGLQPQQG